jgi:prophage regulatory protein
MSRLNLHHNGPANPLGAVGETVDDSAFQPLLLSAEVAARMCGRSEASWWRDHAAGRIPAPIKLGGRTLWRAEELRRWVENGCPPRSVWEALEKVRRK